MLINIGENIRRCRTEQNLTQEQLAYELGVSAQAVSRWETGTTYPDIMLLPVIADFFHLTLDELMGREKELSQKERADFFEKEKVIRQASGAEAAVSYYREILKKYPNDEYLLFGLSNNLYPIYKSSKDVLIKKELYALSDRLSRSQRPGLQCAASRLLILLLCEDGKKEEAKQLVNDLPSFLCGREIMATYLYEGEEQMEYYQFLLPLFMKQVNKYLKKLTILSKDNEHWTNFVTAADEMNTHLLRLQENQAP